MNNFESVQTGGIKKGFGALESQRTSGQDTAKVRNTPTNLGGLGPLKNKAQSAFAKSSAAATSIVHLWFNIFNKKMGGIDEESMELCV